MVMIIESINHVNFYEQAKLKYLFGKSDPMKDYTPISYLQSDGTQYIDTGLKFDKPYYYIVDCEIDNINNNQMFGMYYGYDHGVAVYGGVYQLIDTNYNIYNTSITAGLRTTFTIDKATKTITAKSGNIEDSKTFTGDFFPSSSVYPVVLFAFWTAWNNTLRGYGKGKIYSFKYYEEGVLLRDMIPVIRKSDNKPGIWDKVNEQFYTNQGTGEFITPT